MSAGGANTAGVSSSLDLNYINVMIFMNIYIYCLQVKNGGKDGGGAPASAQRDRPNSS